MIFKTIEDDATLSGQRIKSIFSGLFSSIHSSATIQLGDTFSQSLNDDIIALRAYESEIAAGTPEQQAFINTMQNASLSAREFAASMRDTGMSIDEFASKQRVLQIQSQMGGTSLKSCAAVINTYNGGLTAAGYTQEEFNAAIMQSNPIMAKYLAGLNGSKASLGGYIVKLIGAKLATIGLKIATTALNAVIGMGIGLLISWGMELINSGIEYFKEQLRPAKEKLEEFNNSIKENISQVKELANSYQSLKKNAEDIIPRFAKLAKGVDEFGNKVDLTDEEYEEFIELNNKLAEMFPELNLGMDDSGQYMLALSYSADTLTDSLYKLVEANRLAANSEIAAKLPKQLEDVQGAVKNTNKLIDEETEKQQKLKDIYQQILDRNLPKNVGRYSTLEAGKAAAEKFIKPYTRFGMHGGVAVDNQQNINEGYVFSIVWDYDNSSLDEAQQYLNDQLAGMDRVIENYKEEIKNKWETLNSFLNAWLQTNDSYLLLDDDLQKIVSSAMGNIDFSQFDGKDADDVKDYIQKNLVNPIRNATPEVKDALKGLFDITSLYNNSKITLSEYENQLSQFKETISSAGLSGIFDVENLIEPSDVSKEVEYVKKILKDEFKDSVGDLTVDEIKLAYKIYAANGSLTFDDLKKEIEKLGWLGAEMVDSINLDEFTDKLDDVTKGLDKVVSAMEKLKEGTALSTAEIVNLISKYPELLKQKDLFTDASIEGQNNMLQNLLKVYEAEYDATIDTKIAELKATNEVLKTQMEIEERKAQIVADIKNAEVNGIVVSEAWLTDKIAEFNSLQAQNYATMSKGQLTVNSEVLKQKLEGDSSAAQGSEDIWGQSTIDIADFMVLTAERAKTKVSSKVKWMAQKVERFARELMGWEPGKIFAYTDTGGGDSSTSTGIQYKTKVSAWISEQEKILEERKAAIDAAIKDNEIAISNLENLKGLDLTTILDTGKSSSSGSKTEEQTETIDYIAIALDRAKEAAEKFKKTISDTYTTLSARSSAVKGAINAVTKEISTQYAAAQAYLNAANAVGLSNDLVAKIQNGSLNISEYDSDTAGKIKDYQTYYEKYLDCISSAENLKGELASLYTENFNNIQKDYDNRLSFLEHSAKTLNNEIDLIEEKGHTVTAAYYTKLSNIEKSKLDILYGEKAALEKALNEAVSSGKIEKYSEAWYEMMNKIYGVDEAIQECNKSLAEYDNKQRQLKWDAFDREIDKYTSLLDETEFIEDMLKKNDLVDDKGNFTQSGKAVMGLHGYNYKIYLEEAEKYAAEIESLNAQIAKDPSNKDLIDRRDELLEKQRESILAAEEEKEAIKDLVEDGIDAQLDALKDVIDEYKEALDSAKELYDYQKKVSDETDKIAVLQKKIIAYENDTSEEAKAQIQKLKVDLEKAQEELQETEYDQFISDQKKMLDNLYDDFETILNRRLDNIDSLISGSKTYLSNISGLLSGISNYLSINKNITSGKVPHYASGGMNYRTGFAWLDGTAANPEAVLNAADTKNFLALREALRSIATNNISYANGSYSKVGQLTYSHLLPDYAGALNQLSGARKSSDGVVQHFEISIPIERVEDYNDFVEQLQKDKKFEKMIRAMTIDPAFGGTSLSKNKVVWRNK